MKFDILLDLVADNPLFESSLLLAGKVKPEAVRLQLSRWVKSGRIYQLRRGLYTLASPYQKKRPHPFTIANHLQRASYVSLQSALAYYDLIPETVFVTLSVGTGRPERLETPLGIYEFRHIKASLLTGYNTINLGDQSARLATPEKALLDLIYLQPGGETMSYLRELRLQNLERLNFDLLKKQAEVFGSPKMNKAVNNVLELILADAESYEDL